MTGTATADHRSGRACAGRSRTKAEVRTCTSCFAVGHHDYRCRNTADVACRSSPSPRIDVGLRRWQEFVGAEAVRETGERFKKDVSAVHLCLPKQAMRCILTQPARPPHVPTEETCNPVESLSGRHPARSQTCRHDPKTLRLHHAEQIELGGIKATARRHRTCSTWLANPTASLAPRSSGCGVRAHHSEIHHGRRLLPASG